MPYDDPGEPEEQTTDGPAPGTDIRNSAIGFPYEGRGTDLWRSPMHPGAVRGGRPRERSWPDRLKGLVVA